LTLLVFAMTLISRLFAALLAVPVFAIAAEPEAVFQLEPYRKTIAIHATVGGVKAKFAFDTAAGMTVLDENFVKQVGCRQRQRVVGHQMMGQRMDSAYCENLPVELDGGRYKATAGIAVVADMNKIYQAQVEPIGGLLGLDIFDGKTITIDFPGRRLIVESPASAAERQLPGAELKASMAREIQGRTLSVSVAMPTADGTVWMELDSGNGGTVLVSKPFARLFGLDPDKDKPQKIDFTLPNGLRVTSDMAFAPDMIIDGNIGMPFLKDVVLTMDLRAGRVWIRKP
ncbi:MAG TPA: hypothetical protein VNT33_09215, partial [Telluria sp.]|nr:hypothetical protein [Telluria sp.]